MGDLFHNEKSDPGLVVDNLAFVTHFFEIETRRVKDLLAEKYNSHPNRIGKIDDHLGPEEVDYVRFMSADDGHWIMYDKKLTKAFEPKTFLQSVGQIDPVEIDEFYEFVEVMDRDLSKKRLLAELL